MIKYWNEQLDISHTLLANWFVQVDVPWKALPELRDWIEELIVSLDSSYVEYVPGVWVHSSARIYPSAVIQAPAIIGRETEVRPGAFIRGSVLVGDHCVVGNSTEVKNSVLFDNVQVPHYNYVGDSILGYKSHMGAGSITSNVKSDKSLIVIHPDEIETGLKKMGAILGKHVEIGCNSVLNPGTIVKCNSMVYPLSSVRGTIPENSIFKDANHIIEKQETF